MPGVLQDHADTDEAVSSKRNFLFKEVRNIDFERMSEFVESGNGWNVLPTFEALIPASAKAMAGHVCLSEPALFSSRLDILGNLFYQ